MALYELAIGDLSAAEQRYQMLSARHPDQPEHLLGLAEVRLRQGEAEEAQGIAARALALDDVPVRHQAMLWELLSRALLARSTGREDPTRCAESLPPVLAWLDAAEQALEQSVLLGVKTPSQAALRRRIAQRRGALQELCPASAWDEHH